MAGRPTRLVAAHGLAAVAMAMPWPALLAATWGATGSELWLGVVGAARMAPYVLLSWLAGRLADRVPRLRLLRVVTGLRAGLLVACALLMARGDVVGAVVVATLVVAVGTPAYPALAAAMPRLAGARTDTVTSWLVTVEVSAFVVGPAIGGLLLGPVGAGGAVGLAAVTAVAASAVLSTVETGDDVQAGAERDSGHAAALFRMPGVVRSITAVAVVNAVEAAAALALLPMTVLVWAGGDTTFGVATAALGFGALATPLLHRLARGMRTAVVLTSAALVAVAVSPGVGLAVLPLALIGTAGTQVECEATAVIQRAVPDELRGFALGVADTAMVSAAMVGAAVAPWLAGALGPRVLFALLGVATLAVLLTHRSVVRPAHHPIGAVSA